MMRGKTILIAAFAALLAVGLCACGQQSASSGASQNGQAASSASSSASSNASGSQSSSNANDPEVVRTHAYATMQEVFDAPGESDYWDANEVSFGLVFSDGPKYVLVRAALPEGMAAQIEAAYEADNMDAIVDLVGPLSVYDEYTVESPTAAQIEMLRANLTFQ